MKRIRNAFEDRKAFIAYLTAGDPDLDTTKQLIGTMVQTGVDLIVLGMPQEDTPEQLPDLKESMMRALEAETKTEDVFNMIAGLNRSIRIPMILFTFLRTIKEYGISRFMRRCKECGINGLIVPDLVCEEKNEISRDCNLFGISLIAMVNPGSKERIASLAKTAKGFVYCESSKEELGKNNNIDYSEMVAVVRAHANVPCAMGFGISTPDQAREMAKIADGVLIANGILLVLKQYGKNCIKPMADYVRTIKSALREA